MAQWPSEVDAIVILQGLDQETDPEMLNYLSSSDSWDWTELGFEPRELALKHTLSGISCPQYIL